MVLIEICIYAYFFWRVVHVDSHKNESYYLNRKVSILFSFHHFGFIATAVKLKYPVDI